MRATLGIKWLIVLLGFLCHSIYLNTAAESVTTKPAINNGNIATDTVTTVSLKGVSNSTSQNSITTQSTKLQTPESPQTIPTTTKNTPTGAIPTEKSSTASMTSSSSTATQTAFIPMAVSSSTLAITSMTTTARTAAIPSNGPMQPFQPDATMIPAYSGSTETAATSAPTSVSEAQQSSTSSTSSTTAQTSKAPTLTTVTMKQLSPRDTNKIPESTTVHGRAIANTHPNPGVSSTSSSISSSTSSSTSSRTSFSVNKGVNTATTDSATQVTTVPTSTRTLTSTQLQKFVYSHKGNVETKEKDDKKNLRKVCKRLMESIENGTCTLNWLIQNGSVKIESVEINGKVNESLAQQYYDELTKKELIKTDNKTLIAILASCGALLIMIVILGACASHHRKPYNENQQHLTEELHTVENGYHDNPTLEVMEVQPEMLEKKMVLNGEFNDSWMVPLDHLSKEDHPEEEDTHL